MLRFFIMDVIALGPLVIQGHAAVILGNEVVDGAEWSDYLGDATA